MAGRSTLSYTVRLHPNRVPEDDLGALIRACVAALREGRPTRTFTDDLMDWAARDRSRRRDLQAREEGDTDEHGCTHPYGEQASDDHDGWAPDGTERERPANPETWEANDCDIVGFAPREPQIYTFDPRGWTNPALDLALMEYHSGLVSILGDRTGPHAKALTTWLRFGAVLFAEIGKRLRKGK